MTRTTTLPVQPSLSWASPELAVATTATAAAVSNDLVSLLEECIPHVKQRSFHPVLYHTLGALHHYVYLVHAQRQPHLQEEEEEDEFIEEEIVEDVEGGVEVERVPSNRGIVRDSSDNDNNNDNDSIEEARRISRRFSSMSSAGGESYGAVSNANEDDEPEPVVEEEEPAREAQAPTQATTPALDREEKKIEDATPAQSKSPSQAAATTPSKQTAKGCVDRNPQPPSPATSPQKQPSQHPVSPTKTPTQHRQQQPISPTKSPAQQQQPPLQPTLSPQPSPGGWTGEEQQKKAAAEKRRQLVELQRKLARVQHQGKELVEKRKFLLQEQRKLQLKMQNQQQRTTATNELQDEWEQIQDQLKVVEEQGRAKQREATKLEKHIQNHRDKPLSSFLTATSTTAAATAQQQQQEQAQAALEQHRKAVAEQHRRQVEQQRLVGRQEQERKEQLKKQRFMEMEQRKQTLKHQAAASVAARATGGEDLLMEKLQHQMSALDAHSNHNNNNNSKSADVVVEEEQDQGGGNDDDQPEDPDVARKRIAEEARQRTVQEDWKGTPSTPFEDAQHQQLPGGSSGMSPHEARHGGGQTSSPRRKQPQQQKHDSKQAPSQNSHQSHRHKAHAAAPTHQQQQPSSAPPTPNPHQHQPTGTDQKYTKMAAQDAADEDSANTNTNTHLKRQILITWALQPPSYNCLRAIDQLLCSVQKAYPAPLGLTHHEYFDSWQPIARAELTMGSSIALDEKKVAKAVRKVRFFLHPDKLPRDLTPEHEFLCKLLWDIINDAFEDHERSLEELDWIK